MSELALANLERSSPRLTRSWPSCARPRTRSPTRAKAPATERAYASDWRDFRGFTATIGREALPAEPNTVALYIDHLAARKAGPRRSHPNSRSGSTTRRRASIHRPHMASSATSSAGTVASSVSCRSRRPCCCASRSWWSSRRSLRISVGKHQHTRMGKAVSKRLFIY